MQVPFALNHLLRDGSNKFGSGRASVNFTGPQRLPGGSMELLNGMGEKRIIENYFLTSTWQDSC